MSLTCPIGAPAGHRAVAPCPSRIALDFEQDAHAEATRYRLNLSRTFAPGKNSMNMVDWKYRSFFSLDWITGLISRRPSSWNRVQHYGRIERGDGSISFIMHHRKPGAVFLASQRCSEGGQSWCRVRDSALIMAAAYPAAALAAL